MARHAVRQVPHSSRPLERPDGRATTWVPFMAGLLVTDALMVLFAVVTANAVLVYRGASYSSPPLWTVPLWLVLFGAFGLYQRESLSSGSSEYTRVINACTVGLVAEVM